MNFSSIGKSPLVGPALAVLTALGLTSTTACSNNGPQVLPEPKPSTKSLTPQEKDSKAAEQIKIGRAAHKQGVGDIILSDQLVLKWFKVKQNGKLGDGISKGLDGFHRGSAEPGDTLGEDPNVCQLKGNGGRYVGKVGIKGFNSKLMKKSDGDELQQISPRSFTDNVSLTGETEDGVKMETRPFTVRVTVDPKTTTDPDIVRVITTMQLEYDTNGSKNGGIFKANKDHECESKDMTRKDFNEWVKKQDELISSGKALGIGSKDTAQKNDAVAAGSGSGTRTATRVRAAANLNRLNITSIDFDSSNALNSLQIPAVSTPTRSPDGPDESELAATSEPLPTELSHRGISFGNFLL